MSEAVKELIDNHSFIENNIAFISKNVDADSIIGFIENYRIAGSALWKPKVLTDYIKNKLVNNQLTNWTVAILNSKQDADENMNKLLDLEKQPEKYISNLGTLRLTGRKGDLDTNSIYIAKSYVSARHEWLDYSKDQVLAIEQKYGKKMTARLAKDERESTNGLLLLYPLYGADISDVNTKSAYGDKNVKSYGLEYDYPVFAPAISFSGKAVEAEEEYIVDSESLKQLELEI